MIPLLLRDAAALCARARDCGEVGRATTGDRIMKLSRAAGVLAASSLLWLALPAWGVSCKTQAAMTDAERLPIVEASRQIGQEVQGGRSSDLQAATVPEVAAHFDAIANAASALTPLLKGATITVNAVYRLDAGDAKAGEDQIQFFCDSTDNVTH